jgi:hypothetical protein
MKSTEGRPYPAAFTYTIPEEFKAQRYTKKKRSKEALAAGKGNNKNSLHYPIRLKERRSLN